eukprot:GHVP01001522.1.p1 GENE.GHVP01001522.1~~GHVP01001522.1.p1  ORF type:complete len:141 (+),score=16.04 GHVP01001522.1:1403-1825(+)
MVFLNILLNLKDVIKYMTENFLRKSLEKILYNILILKLPQLHFWKDWVGNYNNFYSPAFSNFPIWEKILNRYLKNVSLENRRNLMTAFRFNLYLNRPRAQSNNLYPECEEKVLVPIMMKTAAALESNDLSQARQLMMIPT